MRAKNNLIAAVVLLFADAFLTGFSWWFAYEIRFVLQWVPLLHGIPRQTDPYFQSVFLMVPVWIFTFSAMGAYRVKKNFILRSEIGLMLRAAFVSLLVFLALSFFLKISPKDFYSRVMISLFIAVNVSALAISRVLAGVVLRFLHRRHINLRRCLIVGATPLGQRMAKAIEKELWTGYRLIGFADEKEKSGSAEPRILGSISQLSKLVQRHHVDHVFIAFHLNEHRRLKEVLSLLSGLSVDISVVPDVYELDLLQSAKAGELDGLPVLDLGSSPIQGWNRLIKRVFDFIFSLLFLVFFSPVFLLVAVGVKLSSPGPIFYRQTRMGLDGKTFTMFKFRSMPVDAEAKSGPKWAKAGEGRATRFGSFLRKTSLDEIPQFWNSLKGDMSVIGPRPERPVFIEEFKQKIPGYMLRHKTKAGITGWAQVNGWRGNTSLTKRIEYDLYYIKNWSLSLDIRIVLLTVLRGFIHPNAY